ncbi:MAG: hypothetical protein CL468_00495 [Acidimicrobiaceae bacterium]|nr:hypothetical protein [Acidimicrobiaceae bacterium]
MCNLIRRPYSGPRIGWLSAAGPNHGTTSTMHKIHCHRPGHPAGTHVISSRAHLSVKPDKSMIVAYPTFSTTVSQTNGFWTTHQRPRGATS